MINKIHKSIIVVALVLVAAVAIGATVPLAPKLSWDGKDSSGAVEASLPVTITVYNADTNAVLSTTAVSGSVTNFTMPTFSLDVPDNTIVTLRIYAKAKDSAGNESPASTTVTKVFNGKDTVAPGTPIINF